MDEKSPNRVTLVMTSKCLFTTKQVFGIPSEYLYPAPAICREWKLGPHLEDTIFFDAQKQPVPRV
jgi:hypothetical protein